MRRRHVSSSGSRSASRSIVGIDRRQHGSWREQGYFPCSRVVSIGFMLALSQGSQQCKHGYLTGHKAAKLARRLPNEKPGLLSQVRGLKSSNIAYSHSFMLVCRGAIPTGSSLVVSIDRLAAESCRVSSRRRLGQIRKLFRNREPAVSFLSPGQKRADFETKNCSKWILKRRIGLVGTRLTK